MVVLNELADNPRLRWAFNETTLVLMVIAILFPLQKLHFKAAKTLPQETCSKTLRNLH
jgi:hypothetical protein